MPQFPRHSLTVGRLCLCLLAGGCQFAGRAQPVAPSLYGCRQLSERGINALERGQWEQAETLLAQAVQTCPTDPEARRHYAEVLWRRGARQDALAHLTEAARLTPDDPRLLARLAEMQSTLGQAQAALAAAERALDLDTTLAPAWAARARTELEQGQTRQALADFHRALALVPDDRGLLLETAELYRQLGQPDRALASLQTLLETYPSGEEPQQPLYLAGLAATALNRNGAAAEYLSAACDAAPPNAEMLCRLGEAQLRAGRPAPADAAARAALALDPQHQPSLSLLDRIAAGRAKPVSTVNR